MKYPIIVQSAREIGLCGGVSGVAYHLEQEFDKMGYQCHRFTIDDIFPSRPTPEKRFLLSKIYLAKDVVTYSLLGTWRLFQSYGKSRNHVVLCHNDAVFGDIYINHGLHKAMIENSHHKWRMLLRNPLHWFLLIREEIRHRTGIHRYVVCLSEHDKEELMRMYPVSQSDIVVIPNGVDIDMFYPSEELRAGIRTRVGVRDDEFVVLFAGHEFRRKGLYYLIQSLRSLSRNIFLWVAGGDDAQITSARHFAKKNRGSETGKVYGAEI